MPTLNLGKVKFNWKGNYDSNATYSIDDIVYNDGSSWMCATVNCSGATPNLGVCSESNTPPYNETECATNNGVWTPNANWNPMALKGDHFVGEYAHPQYTPQTLNLGLGYPLQSNYVFDFNISHQIATNKFLSYAPFNPCLNVL